MFTSFVGRPSVTRTMKDFWQSYWMALGSFLKYSAADTIVSAVGVHESP